MSKFPFANRIAALPPYLFAAIDRVKAEVAARGVDIISLGIGDPELPTPDFIIDALAASARKRANHMYPSYIGMLGYRQAVADWYKTRFGVDLSAEREVLTLIGSKEGIAHFPLAFINPGDLALVCTPNYPVYNVATSFAGGEVEYVPLTEDNKFLPDLDAISEKSWKRAKMIFTNYPNNPTAAMADRAFFEKLVAKAREFNVIVLHDAAYSEVYYDENNKPMSILEIPGAMDVAIEFHSLSKTFNMCGWRIGMGRRQCRTGGGPGQDQGKRGFRHVPGRSGSGHSSAARRRPGCGRIARHLPPSPRRGGGRPVQGGRGVQGSGRHVLHLVPHSARLQDLAGIRDQIAPGNWRGGHAGQWLWRTGRRLFPHIAHRARGAA